MFFKDSIKGKFFVQHTYFINSFCACENGNIYFQVDFVLKFFEFRMEIVMIFIIL